MAAFDYVIVGAGAAGCVLAHRLSEDARTRVALIEAGPAHRHPLISMPKGIGKILLDSPFKERFTWAFPSQPEHATDHASENWARGKVLGGSSSVNGLMWVRGQPADFEELAAQTSEDWNWHHMASAYRAMEAHELGEAPAGGGSGPLHVSLACDRTRLTDAMVDSGVALGLPRHDDVNPSDDGEGIGYAARTIRDGRRVSAATAFLDSVRHRSNLRVMTETTVDRLCFEGRRITGVQCLRGDARETITAQREVIVCGGALSSPVLLQRSGIGPAALLNALGIPCIADLPVGENLAEHRAILLQWKLREPLSQNASFAGVRLLGLAAQYVLRRTGPMAAGAYEVRAWLKSRPDVARADLQFLVAPFSFDLPSGRRRLERFPGMHICAYPLRPTSRGTLFIRSPDPAEPPRLVPNYHATDEDRRTAVDLVRRARQYVAQPALAGLIEQETYPGPECDDDARILSSYARYGTCGYHAVGTCRMGRDTRSVVDPQLRVRGVVGLRVVDTSVFPQIPSGNTNAPTMALAWRAADVIRRAE